METSGLHGGHGADKMERRPRDRRQGSSPAWGLSSQALRGSIPGMNILKKLLRPPAAAPQSVTPPVTPPVEVRPLSPIVGMVPAAAAVASDDTAEMLADPAYSKALSYFMGYPPRSLMSNHCRAVLFSLVRALRAKAVAEIGTLYAGTTEVLARALWENGEGIVYTADPFGGHRCPGIIERWPQELQARTEFHALNSMDFLLHLDARRVKLDLVLVDGNHDYEFALFDLMMVARLLRPGGVVVMDNAEQTGPFRASRTFLEANPAWRELGGAIASHDRSDPFNAGRSSVPETSFILLRAPQYLPIGEGPHSWGQVITESARLDGFALELPRQVAAGTLHYQAILRAFFDGTPVIEMKTVGHMRIDATEPATISRQFEAPSQAAEGAKLYTVELELSWEADNGSPPLAVAAGPTPLAPAIVSNNRN